MRHISQMVIDNKDKAWNDTEATGAMSSVALVLTLVPLKKT